MATEPRSRIVLDPSLLASDEVLEWLSDPELKGYLVISESLRRRLEDPGALMEDLGRFGVYDPDPGLIEAFREAVDLNGVETFSFERARERGELPSGTEAICWNLLAAEEPLADVLADEWAFVTSQSLAALAQRAGHALGAFCRAGATVVGVAKEQMVGALEQVQDRIPPGLLERMKRVDGVVGRGPGLLLAGGSFAASVILPPLGAVGVAIGVVDVLLEGNGVLAGDP
ncbi:MAG TPA: hypothetical protein VFU16_02325 [Solirubrobacterales bacterium]|nr:hypothetical protein [Solirubrobacterales bacterium]